MEKKRKYTSAALTAFISGAIIVIMFLFGFTTQLPLPEEQGVVIEVGGGGGGGGYDQYVPDENNQAQTNSNQEQYLTQNTQDVNYTANNTNSNNSQQQQENKLDSRLQSFQWGQGGGNGAGTGSGTGSGTGTGTGTGTGDGNGSGVGSGDGPAFSLNGRSAKSIPKPKYNEDDQGKVVVTIWVDKNGNVTRAEPGAIGTTVSSAALWNEAKKAALQAKFSVDRNAPEIQKGTITYTFIKLN